MFPVTILADFAKNIYIPSNLMIKGFASEDMPQLSALSGTLVNFLIHADYFSPVNTTE